MGAMGNSLTARQRFGRKGEFAGIYVAKPKSVDFFASRNLARAELSAWLVCSPIVSSPLRAKAAPGSLVRRGAASSLSSALCPWAPCLSRVFPRSSSGRGSSSWPQGCPARRARQPGGVGDGAELGAARRLES